MGAATLNNSRASSVLLISVSVVTDTISYML